jgi:hypothetical protein
MFRILVCSVFLLAILAQAEEAELTHAEKGIQIFCGGFNAKTRDMRMDLDGGDPELQWTEYEEKELEKARQIFKKSQDIHKVISSIDRRLLLRWTRAYLIQFYHVTELIYSWPLVDVDRLLISNKWLESSELTDMEKRMFARPEHQSRHVEPIPENTVDPALQEEMLRGGYEQFLKSADYTPEENTARFVDHLNKAPPQLHTVLTVVFEQELTWEITQNVKHKEHNTNFYEALVEHLGTRSYKSKGIVNPFSNEGLKGLSEKEVDEARFSRRLAWYRQMARTCPNEKLKEAAAWKAKRITPRMKSSEADLFDQVNDAEADRFSKRRVGDVVSQEEERAEEAKRNAMNPEDRAKYDAAKEAARAARRARDSGLKK